MVGRRPHLVREQAADHRTDQVAGTQRAQNERHLMARDAAGTEIEDQKRCDQVAEPVDHGPGEDDPGGAGEPAESGEHGYSLRLAIYASH